MALDVLYQNVRGLRTKSDNFSLNLLSSGADIVCITETWLNSDFLSTEYVLDGYQCFRRDRNFAMSNTRQGGGCLVAVKNGITVERLPHFETNNARMEDIWIKVKLVDSSSLYVCTTYISTTNNIDAYVSHCDSIVNIVSGADVSAKFLILGDYNLPMIQWSMSDDGLVPSITNNDNAATCLLETMDYCGLSQFNHVQNHNNVTLDLVLSNVLYNQNV